MKLFISIFFFSLFFFAPAKASHSLMVATDSTVLPKVFILGQHEKAYEKLFEKHSTVLLEVCEDDMDIAFNKWLSMLKEMEAYATSINYDLKGIKVWLNVFWNKDGSIKHIAYHLKVNSKNVKNPEELSAFFSSFMNHYRFPLISERAFSHYGSASFPTFARRIKTGGDKELSNSKKKQNSPKDSAPFRKD